MGLSSLGSEGYYTYGNLPFLNSMTKTTPSKATTRTPRTLTRRRRTKTSISLINDLNGPALGLHWACTGQLVVVVVVVVVVVEYKFIIQPKRNP